MKVFRYWFLPFFALCASVFLIDLTQVSASFLFKHRKNKSGGSKADQGICITISRIKLSKFYVQVMIGVLERLLQDFPDGFHDLITVCLSEGKDNQLKPATIKSIKKIGFLKLPLPLVPSGIMTLFTDEGKLKNASEKLILLFVEIIDHKKRKYKIKSEKTLSEDKELRDEKIVTDDVG